MADMVPVLSMLVLGFSAGVIHAFDADHIAAVSGISGQNSGRHSFRFALHWGFGHGLAVIAVATLVLVAGAAMPTQFSAVAESAVATAPEHRSHRVTEPQCKPGRFGPW
jgi:high-affinity nickel permease